MRALISCVLVTMSLSACAGVPKDMSKFQELQTFEHGVVFPANRSLTHAEDGVALADGRLLVGDWKHGLVTISETGEIRPFGDFTAAGFKTKPAPNWGSPNGISFEPDNRHVLVADITTGAIYRVDTRTETTSRLYDHPYGVNSVVRDSTGAVWFTQSTENPEGETSEARMFAAVEGMSDGAVFRIPPDEIGTENPVAKPMATGLDFANGIALDERRGQIYVNEIAANRVLNFPVNFESGTIGDKTVLANIVSPDNAEMDESGLLWVTSPFGNEVIVINPDTGQMKTVFQPTPEVSAKVKAEVLRRVETDEPILPLLTPEVWGSMPGLLTGVILTPDNGPIYVTGLGDALVRLQ